MTCADTDPGWPRRSSSLSNLAAWGVAALNRSGEPEAVLVLTERELRLPARQAENTALTLALVFERWRERGDGRRCASAGWFDRAKLESIGFDCSRPVTAEHADYYRTRPPRATYAALEYEGALWLKQSSRLRARRNRPFVHGARSAVRTAWCVDASRPVLDSHLSRSTSTTIPPHCGRAIPTAARVAIVEATAALQYVGNRGPAAVPDGPRDLGPAAPRSTSRASGGAPSRACSPTPSPAPGRRPSTSRGSASP